MRYWAPEYYDAARRAALEVEGTLYWDGDIYIIAERAVDREICEAQGLPLATGDESPPVVA